MDCNFQRFARCWVLLWNVIFMLFGIALMVIGGIGANSSEEIEESIPVFQSFGLRDLSTGVAVIGACLLVVSVIGFVAALKRKKILLSIYAVFMFLVIFAQIALAIVFATTVRDKIKDVLDNELKEQFTDWAQSDDQEEVDRIAKYQDTMECCGWEFIEDPFTTVGDCIGSTRLYKVPCKNATEAYLEDLFDTITWICIILGIVEAICLFSTCVMMCTTSRYGEEDPFKSQYHY